MSQDTDDARPKKRAKKNNATKHGVYSREVMLPGENIRSYRAFAAEFIDEWAPDGPTERSLVDRLVDLHWRKQRLDRYEQAQLQQNVQKIRANNEYGRQMQVLKDLGPMFESAASEQEVDEIMCEISDAFADFIEKMVPYNESPDAAPRGAEIAKFLTNLKPVARFEGPAEVIALVNPDRIQVGMIQSNRVDEAIDRTIKRLMQVKTAKQIFPNMRNARDEPKLINVSRLAGPSAQAFENEKNIELLGKVEVVSAEPTATLGMN